ncbi:DUF2238 domain-containing protein, partial [Candidatus Pacearchaeota archaeon CG10_big_fil_rev_8_21_14_0_10_34_76]
ISKQNYEFLLYIAVLVILFVLVAGTYKKTRFDYLILWMLSVWGLFHMLGGSIMVGGEVLYRYHVLNIFQGVDAEFFILKFDQVLHFYIYFVMSFVMFHLINLAGKGKMNSKAISFFAILASSGVGALNEIVEFGAVVFLGQTGVGGYYNTALDLVFNFVGAFVGGILAVFRYGTKLK